jgi:hypothetical protein
VEEYKTYKGVHYHIIMESNEKIYTLEKELKLLKNSIFIEEVKNLNFKKLIEYMLKEIRY